MDSGSGSARLVRWPAKPTVLILDEPTSAHDMRSETLIQQTFEELVQARTLPIVAHRMTTPSRSDRLMVLGEDGIQAFATPAELARSNGFLSGRHPAVPDPLMRSSDTLALGTRTAVSLQLVCTARVEWAAGDNYLLVAVRRLLDAGINLTLTSPSDGPAGEQVRYAFDAPELVALVDDATGARVGRRDTHAFAETIARLALDPAVRTAMAQHATRRLSRISTSP